MEKLFTDAKMFWFQVLLKMDYELVKQLFEYFEKHPQLLDADQRFAISAILALSED
jgi:hypothetical protein